MTANTNVTIKFTDYSRDRKTCACDRYTSSSKHGIIDFRQAIFDGNSYS